MVYKSFIQRLFDKFQILFMFIGIIMIIVVTVFMLTDIDTSESVLEMYESLNTTNADNSDTMKKLNFLASYVKETGDLKIFKDVGLAKTDEEAEKLFAEAQGGQEDSKVEQEVGETVQVQSLTKAEWQSALAAKNHSYYTESAGFTIIEFPNGNAYLSEKQAPYWSDIQDSEGVSKDGKDYNVKSAGCWLFAQATAISNLTKEVHSIAELFSLRHDYDTGIEWDGSRWIDKKNQYRVIGQEVVSNENKAFNHFGLQATLVGQNYSVRELSDLIKQQGSDDCMFIGYFHTSKTCSGTNHWICIAGVDESGNLYLLNNANRTSILNPNDVGTIKGGNIFEVTTVIKVTKQ